MRKRELAPNVAKLIEVHGDLSPDLWAGAIRQQQERVAAASAGLSEQARQGGVAMLDMEPFRRVRFESHFLLVAISHVLKVQKIWFDLTGDPRLAETRRESTRRLPTRRTFGT
jgi:hypothetical protein